MSNYSFSFILLDDKQKRNREAKKIFFTYEHMFKSFSIFDNITCSEEVSNETTHILLMDSSAIVDSTNPPLHKYRDQGIKVSLFTFDPPSFKRVDSLIQKNMIDNVFLFDSKFKDRFNIKTYITDYFFNDEVFPDAKKENNGKICIFGHHNNQCGRHNNWGFDKIDNTSNTYIELYDKLQLYNGAYVWDTGNTEDMSGITVYNKAKAVETLMCGRNPYCREGIKTLKYDRFLKKGDSPVQIDFEQNEIRKLNKETLEEVVYNITS